MSEFSFLDELFLELDKKYKRDIFLHIISDRSLLFYHEIIDISTSSDL